MKIYLNAQYKCVKVEDNTFVANSTSNFIRYYFVQNADGTLADEITESTEVYLNQEPSYVTLGFRRADGNTIQHLMATPKVENNEPFWEYIISDADGILYKKGALEVSAQFINATLNSENKIISQKVMAVAINTAHILDNIGEEAEEYYSQYEQANNEAHAALQSELSTFVPKQLAGYRQITAADNTPTFRTNAYTYVNNGVNGYRMSLQAIKELNTKIMSVDSISDADFNKLSVGDFIYSKN